MTTVAILAPVPSQFVYQSLLAVTDLAELKVVSLGNVDAPNFDLTLRKAAILLGDYTFAHPVDAALLDRGQHLRFIQQPSVGYQH